MSRAESALRPGEALRLPARTTSVLAVAWVAGIALVYLAPGPDRAWWAIPLHAFDALLDIPRQLVPGAFAGEVLGRALGGVGVAGFILAACAAAGDLLLGMLHARPADRAWRCCTALGAGSWVVSTQALIFGSAGLMSPWLHGGALAFWLAAWAAAGSRAAGAVKKPRAAASCQTAPSVFLRWMVVLIAAVLVLQFVAALTPPFEYDTLEYHLGAPAWYLARGRIEFVPGNVYSNFPALTGMLYIEALALGSEAAAKLMHFLLGGATALAIAAWARRRWGRGVGAAGAAVFLALPFTMQLAMTARIDLATGFLGFLAIADAVAVRQEGRSAAVRAALFAGAACCTKYTAALLVALPAGVIAGWGAAAGAGGPTPARVRRGLLWGAGVIAAAGAMTAPWLVKNWVLTGNPAYPLLSSWLGGRDWSPELDALFRARHLHPDALTGLIEFLRKPFVYSVVEPGALPVFLMLLPLLALRRNEPAYPGIRRAGAGVLLIAAAWGWGTYAPWRFFYPAAGMLCLLAATATDGWQSAPLVRRAARAGAGFCLAWGVMIQIVTVGTDMLQPGRYPAVMTPFTYASGQVSRREFVRPVAGAIFWMNEHLPPEAHVLYAGEARTYYAAHRFLANTVYDHSAVGALIVGAADEGEIALRMRAAGLTHVFVNGSELRRLHANYGYLDGEDLARLQRFLDAFGRLVYGVEGGQAVYELLDAGEAGP